MDAHLITTTGTRAGSAHPLDKNGDNLIGRGLDCHIVLTDPLSSRVHAVISADDDGWWVRGRFQGVEHQLALGPTARYRSPRLELELTLDPLQLLDHNLQTPEADGTRIELPELATMLLLLEAIKEGAPGLPLAAPPPISP